MLRLPKSPFLYPIVDTQFSLDPVVDVRDLIRAGVSIVQYRAKQQTKLQVYKAVKELELLCDENNVLLIVNDLVDVALVTKAAGVHLGQEDFPATEAVRLMPDRIIGQSTHNQEQFELANTSSIQYIAVGPVYETNTKRSLSPTLGLRRIIPFLEQKSRPVVAIGGIRLENVRELVEAGVDGIAIISELYRHGPVYDSARRLLDELTAGTK